MVLISGTTEDFPLPDNFDEGPTEARRLPLL